MIIRPSVGLHHAFVPLKVIAVWACIVAGTGCRRDQPEQDAGEQSAQSQQATEADSLTHPDSASCGQTRQVPIILERDSIGHYRLNQATKDSVQLATWVQQVFIRRPADIRWIMIRQPETFTRTELLSLTRLVQQAGGRAYAFDPRCFHPVPDQTGMPANR
jgi:hypothetical protein